MRWLDGITSSMDTKFEQTPGAGEGQGSLACCSLWGCKESDMTERLNNSNLFGGPSEAPVSTLYPEAQGGGGTHPVDVIQQGGPGRGLLVQGRRGHGVEEGARRQRHAPVQEAEQQGHKELEEEADQSLSLQPPPLCCYREQILQGHRSEGGFHRERPGPVIKPCV